MKYGSFITCATVALSVAVRADMQMGAMGDGDMADEMAEAMAEADKTLMPTSATGSGSLSTATISAVPHEPKHVHGLPILDTKLTPAERLYWESYNTTTFFNLPAGTRGAGLARYHAAAVALATAVVHPATLALYGLKSRATLRMHVILAVVNTALLLTAMFALLLFKNPVPYAGNAYGKTCYVVVALCTAHSISTVVRYATHDRHVTVDYAGVPSDGIERFELVPADRHHSHSSDGSELSTIASPQHKPEPQRELEFDPDLEARRRALSPHTDAPCSYIASVAGAVQRLTAWPLLFMLMIHCCIGLAVGNLFGQGLRVFNLLAHWIKGGVFVLLGILSLARYCGYGTDKGWAWNLYRARVHPTSALNNWRRLVLPYGSVITMEYVESFLIFFYGTSNVFLEHLSNTDGEWHAKDLQHVSIAFMFIGCGLCGLITEYKLSDWRTQRATEQDSEVDSSFTGTPGFSPNPFPAFTIFWTGILMSQHAQASATSTAIHVQWGLLLSYGSFFRVFTFLLLAWKPSTDGKPAKPFTELITSFCLLCGGLIFMESTDQVVEALEYRGLTSMFTFNISVGFVTLFMAWEMLLFLWRDWLQQRVLH